MREQFGALQPSASRKRVLVVNAFFDEYRRMHGSPHRVPRAAGPIHLAGAFNPETTEVRVHNEQAEGPLHNPALLGWPDLLVLTGLTNGFDRMLHLCAYARALNPRVVVAAGGPAVRALPRRAARFFDHASIGDIESLRDIARDVLGPAHVAEEMFPRFDLDLPSRLIAYVESSRNCNFRCEFCALTGEGGGYLAYPAAFLERQLAAVPRGRHVVLLDNNFYGNDRRSFNDRVAVLRDFVRNGRIRGWVALVTGDFFARPANLDLVREAGCIGLFSGVESFDQETLLAHNKKHSTILPQVRMIRDCLQAGLLFVYGLMLDPSTRSLADLRAEIDFVLNCDEITLPAYLTLAIPLLGTPYFRRCMEAGLLLPRTRLSDLDGVTLAMRPLDPLEDAAAFARGLPNLAGFRHRLPGRMARFAWRYRGTLSPLQHLAAAVQGGLIGLESAASSPTRLRLRAPPRSFVSTTETLHPLYRPVMPLPQHLEAYFRPTMVTDAAGELSEDVAEDLADARAGATLAKAGV